MLRDLIRRYSLIHIAGAEYRVYFSLNAMLCLELTYKPLRELFSVPFDQWTTDDILQLTRAALCDLPENAEAVNNRDFDAVKPDLYELGQLIRQEDLPLLSLELVDAVLASLPPPDPGKVDSDTAESDEGDLRAYCVDVIGMPESEFWQSNQRELSYRIDKYQRVKGYDADGDGDTEKIIVKQYDDI